MWTGKPLNREYECLYEMEVICDKEKCTLKEIEHPICHVDEMSVRTEDAEYSRGSLICDYCV